MNQNLFKPQFLRTLATKLPPPFFITSLQQCAAQRDISKGQQLHAQLLKTGLFFTSPLPTTSLINMYAKCNRMDRAFLVFSKTHVSNLNVFAYNAIISGFISNGLVGDALGVYMEMRREGVTPDKFTLPCVIKGFCEVMEVVEVRKVHGLVFKFGMELDVFVGSALVHSYLKFELMEDALSLFDEMPDRDVGLWNSMVNGYAQIGGLNEALGICRRMNQDGVLMSSITVTGVLSVFSAMGDSDNGRVVHGFVIKMGFDSVVSVCNALIDLYGKCDCIGNALEIFEMMGEKDIFSWNSIIAVHEQCGDHDGTLKFFDKMLSHAVCPDVVTVTAVLPACSHLAALMPGRGIHGYMIVTGMAKDDNCEDNVLLLMNNSLLDMYAKCGSLRDARLLFNEMNSKDVASWNIMIMCCGMRGYASKALGMFKQMCEAGINPDAVTFLSVLSACSHAGFLCQGRDLLEQMGSKYGVVPSIEHYACTIDMLGRAGHLEEAYKLALTMPMKANSVVWRSLLAACQLHGNADIAEIAAQRVFELESEHCGNYVLLSNSYVAAGRYDEVSGLRHTMRQQNVQKIPGCSWLELKNGMHAFLTCDKIHPEISSIYAALQLLTAHLRGHGYLPHL